MHTDTAPAPPLPHLPPKRSRPPEAAPAARPALPQPANVSGQPWHNALSGTGKHLDPICGKPVDEKNALIKVGAGRRLVREYQGQLFYFCSIACKREFDANPEYHGRKALGRLEESPPGKSN